MAQVNPTVGDLEGNAKLIASCMEKAKDQKADVLIFPEMAVTGYPPLDLLPPREVRTETGEIPSGPLKFLAKNRFLAQHLAEQASDAVKAPGFVRGHGRGFDEPGVPRGGEDRRVD